MKLLVMTAGILLCAASAFAHDGREYGHRHDHGRHWGHEHREHAYREYREERVWYPAEVAYRSEYRPVEPRVSFRLPPLPTLPPLPLPPLPPFIRFH